MASGSKVWSVFSLAAALGAAAVARKTLDTSWKAATGKKPPENPADPDVEIWEAVSWAVVTGAFIARGPHAGPAQGGVLLHEVHRPPPP